jgi:serine/threonine-protein kinase
MPASEKSAADRNLLFGILALQMDFITRDGLIRAMNAWVLEKSKPLGRILLDQGSLAADDQALLEALVEKHLKLHGNDAEKSLAAVGPIGAIREELKQLGDRDLEASLRQTAASKGPDPYVTQAVKGEAASTTMRFRILRPYAKGGLGSVYVAEDEELHREVALKEIQDEQAHDLNSRSRFLLEAEITGRLEHPGIVPVYGLGYYGDGRPFYAMRFIRGDNLKDAIERFHKGDVPGRDPGERMLELRKLLGRFIDVCNAIDYAHSRGVLHRDLKPGNVMLGNYGETLVVDWGLAKPVDLPEQTSKSLETPIKASSLSGAGSTDTRAGEAMGTPQYMSPEQAEGRLDKLGPPSDVYSLGATLYSLLTGKPPFEASDVGAVLLKVVRGDFSPPRQVKPSVPPALEAVCLKAMSLHPQDRYPSVRALADEIERWLADEPVKAWPEPWTVRARRWISRHRTIVSSSGAALGMTVILLVVLIVTLTKANQREREAREEAVRQRDLAEANFRVARKAVDRYYTEVSESDLLNEPGMEPLRKKLLESAREFYSEFAVQRANDPAVRDELGRALYRLGQITAEIQSRYQGIDSHRQALAIFSDLAARNPQAVDYAKDLASCYYQLGRLYRLTDQVKESKENYTKAKTIWETLRQADPREQYYTAELSRTELGLGNVSMVTGSFKDAKAAFQRALTLREELATLYPKNPEYQRDLAISCNNLASALTSLGEPQAAEFAYNRALGIQEKLSAQLPAFKRYQDDLARTHFNLGNLYARLDRTGDADREFHETAKIWEILIAVHPSVTDFHVALAGTYNNLANLYRSAGKTGDSQQAFKQALRIERRLLDEHPDVPAYRDELARFERNLANLYRTTGQLPQAEEAFRGALADLDQLVNGYADVPQYQIDRAATNNDLGLLLRSTKRADEARAAWERALADWNALDRLPAPPLEQTIDRAATLTNLADMARERGDTKGSVDWYGKAIASLDPIIRGKQLGAASARQTVCKAYGGRAELRTSMKEFAGAVDDWRSASELADDKSRPWYLYRLAGTYSQYAAVVRADTRLTETERGKLADEYAAKSVELLGRASNAGYFKSADKRSEFDRDRAFDSVRARPEFKKLAEQIDGR